MSSIGRLTPLIQQNAVAAVRNALATVTNYSLVETTINTLKMGKCEVQGSSGARAVFLYGWMLDVQEPDKIASTTCKTDGFLGIGNLESLTTFGPTTDGGVDYVFEHLQCDATPLPVLFSDRGPRYQFLNLREQYIPIPKSPDGKFYITVGVKGTSNGAGNFKYVYTKAYCLIIR